MQSIKADVLKYLFVNYKENPTRLVDITDFAREYDPDLNKLGQELTRDLFIRDYAIDVAVQRATARISIRGIRLVDPQFVVSGILDVIEGLGSRGGKGEVMDILGLKKEEYAIGLDFSSVLEERRYINNVLPIHSESLILAQLTDAGWNKFNNKADFIDRK